MDAGAPRVVPAVHAPRTTKKPVAPGAKIAAFDASYTGVELFVSLGGNLVWETGAVTGAKIHSNSWGGSTLCEVTELEILYDAYMYEVSHTTLEYAKHLPQVRSLRSGGGRPTGLLNRIPGWAHQRGRSTAGWQPELFDSS